MSKIYNLPNNLLQIEFNSPRDQFKLYWDNFLNSELGKIYRSIPWKELAKELKPKRKREARGRKSIFDLQGKLALMFLKNYTGYSDRKLIERLNTDYSFQFFCGIYLQLNDQIEDYKIVSKIRVELGSRINVERLQEVLAGCWKPYLKDTHVMMADATCYESQMRYPTSVKLLWEGCEWIYNQMKHLCKRFKLVIPRSKYLEQKDKYYRYQKNRKKTYKATRKRIVSLLKLLKKLHGQLNHVIAELPTDTGYTENFKKRLVIIAKVIVQQQELLETGVTPKKLIVSIDKSYIRPIVRGKETKRVEFGAKVNTVQIDGINFIEHISFDAFHEGNRLQSSIWLARGLFGKCTHVAADAIYATNANRSYCKEQNISTSFVRKGKPAKDEKQRKVLRSMLSKERATRLEGSFGTEKNHYALSRIKARTKQTEILWIFFGIHTCNAVKIAHRLAQSEQIKKAA